MKTANILQITINGKKVKEKIICPYCESGQVYPLKKDKKIYCRMCSKKSHNPVLTDQKKLKKEGD